MGSIITMRFMFQGFEEICSSGAIGPCEVLALSGVFTACYVALPLSLMGSREDPK